MNDKKERKIVQNGLLDDLIGLVHNRFPVFRIMMDHHRSILRTETVIETLCSFLSLTFTPRRRKMDPENIQKNTVNKLNHQRSDKERDIQLNHCTDRFYAKVKRHGVITDKKYLKKRGHNYSKTIERLKRDLRKSIFRIPLKLKK